MINTVMKLNVSYTLLLLLGFLFLIEASYFYNEKYKYLEERSKKVTKFILVCISIALIIINIIMQILSKFIKLPMNNNIYNIFNIILLIMFINIIILLILKITNKKILLNENWVIYYLASSTFFINALKELLG